MPLKKPTFDAAPPQTRQLPDDLPAQLLGLDALADKAARERILIGLIQSPSPGAIDCAISLLPQASITVRNELIDTLRDAGAAAMPRTAELLASKDANLRIYALSILEGADAASLCTWLAGLLETETDANVAGQATELLGNVGDATHLALVRRVGERFNRHAYLQSVVAQALARLDRHA